MTGTDTVSTTRRGRMRSAAFFNVAATVLVLVAAFPIRLRYGFAVFGSFSVLDVGLAALGVAIGLHMVATRRPLRTGDDAVALLLAVPFLICIFSLSWSEDLAATFRQIGIFAEAVMTYWVVVNVLRELSVETVFSYLALFVILLLFGSLLSLAQVPGFEPPTYGLQEGTRDYYTFLAAYYARLGHPFYGLSNDFASVLSLFVFPFLAWGVVERKPLYLLLSTATFGAVLLTQSRGVIAATVLGGLVFLATQRRRLLRWLPPIGVGSALVLGASYFYYRVNETVQIYLGDRLQITTIQARRDLLSAGWSHLADSPLLGYGGGVVPRGDLLLADGVHNTYLQHMLYYGVPLGLLAIGALWLLALRFVRWPTQHRAVRLIALSMGISIGVQLVVFVGETSFEATLPKTALYLFAGFCAVIIRVLTHDTEDRTRSATE